MRQTLAQILSHHIVRVADGRASMAEAKRGVAIETLALVGKAAARGLAGLALESVGLRRPAQSTVVPPAALYLAEDYPPKTAAELRERVAAWRADDTRPLAVIAAAER